MSAITLQDVLSIGDLQQVDRFEILLGVVPGGGDTSNLTLKCINVSLPGVTTTPLEQKLHGHKVKFQGQNDYSGTLPITYAEDVTHDTRTKLLRWKEFSKGTRSGNASALKSGYCVNADIVVYDPTGKERERITLWNCFVQEVGEVQMSGDSTTGMQVTTTLSYDYWTSNLAPAL
jgi:hypothetical protein